MGASATVSAGRSRLSRERVLATAMAQADAGGLEALTMRTLAEELGVAPMALYRHVTNKDDLTDAMIDLVFSEVGVPLAGSDWRSSMRERALSVRDALSRHRWAIGLMEARRHPGPANLRHHDAVLGRLRAAGFSIAMAAHAYSLLDSYIYGFVMTHLSPAFQGSELVPGDGSAILAPLPAAEYPNLVELAQHASQPAYDYDDEFEYGLNLILESLERARGSG